MAIQIPYLPNTFDMGAMLDAYRTGAALRQHQAQLEDMAAERKARSALFEKQMKKADLEAELAKLKSQGDVISLLESMTKEQQGPAAGQPIHMGAPSLGLDVNVVPRTAEEVLAAVVAKKKEEMALEAEKQRMAKSVTLPPGMAERLNLPPGTTNVDSELLSKLDQMVSLPPEMGGGQAPKSAAELIKSVFTEGQAGKRSAATNATTLQAAQIRANAPKQEDQNPDAIDAMASQVATGQIKLPNIPVKQRNAVLVKLNKTNTAIPDSDFFKKMDQFSTAQEMISALQDSLKRYQDAQGLFEKTKAITDVEADRSAFSRLIGRSLGEKGVFTDQDKNDFARVLSTNMPALALAPSWSDERAARLKDVMNRVRQRAIQDLEKRTGKKYREGGVLGDTTDTSTTTAPATAEDFLKKYSK